MGQILSIFFSCLWGGRDDQFNGNEKLPLISPPSSGPALQSSKHPNLASYRNYYTLQTNHVQSLPPLAPTTSNSNPVLIPVPGSGFRPNPVTFPVRSVPSCNSEDINAAASKFPQGLDPEHAAISGLMMVLNPHIPTKLKVQVAGSEKKEERISSVGKKLEQGRNWCNYKSCEEEDELEEPKLIIGVKWIKHYSSGHKILLVGEGDFSFSASLALAFASAKNITASSLDSIGFLSRNYNRALPNIHRLQSLGALVMHDVDATKMANVFPFKYMLLDRVIYNFPLAGFFREKREDQTSRNQKLILLFLENAKKMIKMDGEIHITHKSNGFFREWNLELVASTAGLRLIEEVPFFLADYPVYKTKYGFGGDKNFDCVPSKTYKFGLKKSYY